MIAAGAAAENSKSPTLAKATQLPLPPYCYHKPILNAFCSRKAGICYAANTRKQVQPISVMLQVGIGGDLHILFLWMRTCPPVLSAHPAAPQSQPHPQQACESA